MAFQLFFFHSFSDLFKFFALQEQKLLGHLLDIEMCESYVQQFSW